MQNDELKDMLRVVIQEELKPINERLARVEQGQQVVNQELQELRQGQDKLDSKVTRLEIRMENEVIDKVRVLFDGFALRGNQIDNLQKHVDERLDSIEIDTNYLVARVARLEKLAK